MTFFLIVEETRCHYLMMMYTLIIPYMISLTNKVNTQVNCFMKAMYDELDRERINKNWTRDF